MNYQAITLRAAAPELLALLKLALPLVADPSDNYRRADVAELIKDGIHRAEGGTFLVWNGSDGYTETTEPAHFVGPHSFKAFRVLPVSIDAVPIDEDGDKDFSGGFYLTDSGKVYREV